MLWNLLDNFKHFHIRIIGVPEWEEEEQEIENFFENITENFPNLSKEINFQEVQEAQRVPKNLVKGITHQSHYNYITQD